MRSRWPARDTKVCLCVCVLLGHDALHPGHVAVDVVDDADVVALDAVAVAVADPAEVEDYL